jgi:hypothetical protein
MNAPFITTLTRDYALTGDLSDNQVDIHDIAMSLARLNRYTGHTLLGWSVAQHSLLVLRLAEQDANADGLSLKSHLARALLLHDAHEAYCGDVASPIKLALGNAWTAFETAHADHVRAALGVQRAALDFKDEIKHYDLVALRTERSRLLGTQRDRLPWPVLDGQSQEWSQPLRGDLETMAQLQDETHTRKAATDAFLHAYQRTTLAALRASDTQEAAQ